MTSPAGGGREVLEICKFWWQTVTREGGREVGRNGDILAPKNCFSTFQFFSITTSTAYFAFVILGSIQNIFHHISFRRKEKLWCQSFLLFNFLCYRPIQPPKVYVKIVYTEKKVCHYLAGDKGREGGVLIWWLSVTGEGGRVKNCHFGGDVIFERPLIENV